MQKDILLLNRNLHDINPLLVGEEQCTPGHRYGPAIREYYIIHYATSGAGCFETEGKCYHLRAGDMFLIRPEQVTVYEADKEQPWHYIWVGFTSSLDLDEIFCENVISSEECRPIFEGLLECEKLTGTRELFVCGKIYELLTILFRKVQTEESLTNRYIPMAKNYIESNYSQHITVDMIARYLNLDRSYFSSIFKQQTGKAPQRYLVDYRLQKAAQFMLMYDYTPSEAAASCGYADVFNFSRMFKQKYGMAPQYYKKANGRLRGGIIEREE